MAQSRWARWLAVSCFVAAVAGAVLAPSARGAGVLDEIAGTGVFRLGLRSDVRPFAFADEQGQPAGFCVDMACLLVAKLAEYAGRGMEIVVVPITSTNRLDKVAGGEAMIEMGASTHNAARDVVVDFSLPYFLSETTFMVRADSGLSSLADLAGKVVSATAGTANLSALEAAVADGRLAGSTIRVSDSHEQGMTWLRDGTIDAYFTDTVLLLSLRATWPNPDEFTIVQEPIQSEPYGWILPEDDSDWRDFVDNFLIWTLETPSSEEGSLLSQLAILEAGEAATQSVFDAIYNKWFGPRSGTPVARSAEFDALLSAMQWPGVSDVWPGKAGE